MITNYKKQPKTNLDHIQALKDQGLVIVDHEKAHRYLSSVTYYRLSAYMIPFQHPPHKQFKANTSFDDIINLYNFDRELRLLVLDGIERIEIAIRTQVCNVLCDTTNNVFWYIDKQNFSASYNHTRLIHGLEETINKEIKRLSEDEKSIDRRNNLTETEKNNLKNQARKENFLRHYISKYSHPSLPPCWMMLEMLTLGELTNLYLGLSSNKIKKKIGQNIQLQARVLDSWLQCFNIIRNLCAHHHRLWNREHGFSIKTPESPSIVWLNKELELSDPKVSPQKRTYIILVAIQSILYKIDEESRWAKKLNILISDYTALSKAHMGMPEDWHSDRFWDKALRGR